MGNQEKVELKNIFKELKNGNKEAIETLYKKYNKMIYGVVFSILKNKEDSEDIVQTVFTKLQTIEKEKLPKDKEASWLYAVARNETLMFLRKQNTTYDIEKIYDLEDENNEIEKIIDKETYNKLISGLNDKEKQVISLKIISNLSFSEISQLLGESIGTIKWRYYKSIYTLKILLSNLGMFIVTFILGLSTFKRRCKISNLIEDEFHMDNFEDKEESTKGDSYGEIIEDKTEENIIVEEPIGYENINYFGYSLLGISTVFLTITIIFSIILKKHQLKRKQKSSK